MDKPKPYTVNGIGVDRKKGGFASLTPERRREIASMGGKAVKPENRAFSKSHTLARKAGSAGGHASAEWNQKGKK